MNHKKFILLTVAILVVALMVAVLPSLAAQPTVAATTPADGATNVPINTSVIATLNLPNGAGVNSATVNNNTVYLFPTSQGAGAKVATFYLSANGVGNQITLIPDDLLQPNTSYTFIIDGIADNTGEVFAAYRSVFTTGTGITGGSSGSVGNVPKGPFDPTITITPALMAFGDLSDGIPAATQNLLIENTGGGNLTVNTATIAGADAAQFAFAAGNPGTFTLAPGASATIGIQFNASGAAGPRTATLTFNSNDPITPNATVTLNGLAQTAIGGNNEPSLQAIFNAFNTGLSSGDDNVNTTIINSATPTAFPMGSEIIVPTFERAGPGPVTTELIAAYAHDTSTGAPEVQFGYYMAGDTSSRVHLWDLVSKVVVPGNDQALNPVINGVTSFDPGLNYFGLYGFFIPPPFNNRYVYTEDNLNAPWSITTDHHVRVYPYGPNTYILAWEEYTAGWDFNDIVVVLRNVQPAGTRPLPDVGVSPASMSFTQPIGSTSLPHQLTISNNGSAPLVINSVNLTGADAPRFNIVGGGPSGISLTPGGSITLDVTFTPTTLAAAIANIVIDTNDPFDNPITVVLQGQGTGTPPAGGIDFENLDWTTLNPSGKPGLEYLDRWLTFSRIQVPNCTFPICQPTWPLIQMHDIATLRIHNRDTVNPLQINSLVLSDTTKWQLLNGATPFAIPANGFYDLQVQFIDSVPNPNAVDAFAVKGIRPGTLTVNSSDPVEPQSIIQLRGGYMVFPEGSHELTLDQTIAAFGITSNINPTQAGAWIARGEEVLEKYWQQADTSQPIYLRQISAFHGCCTAGSAAYIRFNFAASANQTFTHGAVQGQTLLPRNGSNTGPLEAVINNNDTFHLTIHGRESCDAPCGNNHGVRMWPYRNPGGQIVPNAYFVAMDYTGGGANYDYQDNTYLITNIQPVVADPDVLVTGVDSPDPVALGNQLTYQFTVNNNAPIGAANVTMTITLDASVNFVSATPAVGTCGAPVGVTITCNLGNMASFQTILVNVVVTPTVETIINASATVATTSTDTDPTNNNVSISTEVGTGAPGNITIIKDADIDGSTAFTFNGTNGLGGFQLVDDGTITPGSFTYQYNFGREDAIVAGYVTDSGQAYGGKPNGQTYGWLDMSGVNYNGTADDRYWINSHPTDPGNALLESYMHMQRTQDVQWEHALPNGRYRVTVTVGEPRVGTNDSSHTVRVEGSPLISNFVTTGVVRERTQSVDVYVTDGRLTLDAIGGTNTKIIAVVIEDLPTAPNEQVFANLAVGSYNITEVVPGGWALDNIICTNLYTPIANGVQVNLTAGMNITCTFYNTQTGGPTGNPDTASVVAGNTVNIAVLANDVPGLTPINPATVTVVDAPTQGTFVVNANGTIDYTANALATGTDTFTYTVLGNDGLSSRPTTVTVTINQPPQAVNDTVNVAPNGTVNINVVANDLDDVGVDVTTVTVVGTPTQGTFVVNANGTVDYTNTSGVAGTDTFTYTVEDGDGEISNVATVTINIGIPGSPPNAVDDNVTTPEDNALVINVLGNDTDPDGDALDPTSVTIVTPPASGTATVDPVTGEITFTPAPDVSGTFTFTYTVTDSVGATSTPGTVTVTVTPQPDAPVAVDDTAATIQDTPTTFSVIGNDTDVDGDAMDPTTVTAGSVAPTNGVISIDPVTGDITYTPNAGVTGTDTFTYTVMDVTGQVSNEATVTVNINLPGPSIAIDITPATQFVQVGNASNFTITVTNTGGEDLNNVVVLITNSVGGITGNCQHTIGTLAMGANNVHTCSDNNITQNYTKTAIVNANPSGGGAALQEQDSADVTAVNAGLFIEKTPATQTIAANGDADFTITVTNTGGVALNNVIITDPLVPACDADSASHAQLAALAVGASFSYTCTDAGVTASYTNQINAEATEAVGGATVTATDTADITVAVPGIEIAKTPDSQVINAGADATFTITITNTGGVDLTDIAVTDALTPACNADSTIYPELAAMAVGAASFSYNCTATAVAADFTNVADVAAVPVGRGSVTDTDDAIVTVFIPAPSITIDKTPDNQVIASGDNANFTITLTNNGNVTLNNIVVDDPLVPSCIANFPTMAPGASQSYACTANAVTAGFTNTATVTAEPDGGGAPVNAADTADVQVAALEITKTPLIQVIASGGQADFTIDVTNTGDVDLLVDVTDALSPACNNLALIVPAGATSTYVCSQLNVTADFTNTINAVGGTAGGVQVTAQAQADVLVGVAGPSISIIMTPATQLVPAGGPAAFSVTVTNNGNEALTGVTVLNSTVPSCDADSATVAALANMAIGDSVTYTCTDPAVFADYNNTAVVTGTKTSDGLTVDDTVIVDVTISIFDPPFGRKTVNENGAAELEWGFFWINPNNQPLVARVTDPIPTGFSVIPGSLSCTTNAGGTLTTTLCAVQGNQIVWEGTLAPDPGATNLSNAVNPLIIRFRTAIPDGVNNASNVASMTFDSNNDGTPETTVNTNRAEWSRTGGTTTTDDASAQGAAVAPPSLSEANISKTASTPFAQAGNPVTFLITISNPTNQAVTVISVEDVVPSEFVILSAEATVGNVAVNGQRVTFNLDVLSPGQSVTITVQTRVSDSAGTFISRNIACMTDGANHTSCASADVISVTELPRTGESPWSAVRPFIFGLIGLILTIAAGWVLRRRYTN